MVNEVTRSELVAGVVQRSTIDHCYSDVPFVESEGDSDHMGVRILKYGKNPVSKPEVIRMRVYKNFSVENFLTDILHSNINNSSTSHLNIEGASEAFRNEFCAILDYHAPVKTIQVRKNFRPTYQKIIRWISQKEILFKRKLL